ncbi:MAG: glycosyltransferase family 39 protein [Alphaproteobacteria bacterium]|nr:glycosyltransferase family 39 protein [Alphaproteobacteria bacterium]
MSEAPPIPWWRDRVAWWALLAGLWLRAATLARWPQTPCIRDECTYVNLAERIVDGEGMTAASGGWLWAPGYPAVMAAHDVLLGQPEAIKGSQVALSVVTMLLAYTLARDIGGRGAARWAVWLYALSPTFVFFTVSMWSEWLYLTLLLGSLLALGWARRGGLLRGALPGALVGLCVLLRGVATYMLPIFGVGLLWGRWRSGRAWGSVVALALGAALVVGPYATRTSARYEGRVISDRTLGQMMWLGNNDFPPMTFDWGNGTLTQQDYTRALIQGRPHCPFQGDPTVWDDCEVRKGVRWIQEHPDAFVQRIPLRLAQLFNPHSFLTRHLKWGRWKELNEAMGRGLILATVGWSLTAILGGTAGMVGRGRSWRVVVMGGILLYHFAAIGLLAGLSRYRVPLDGLWLLWAAALLASPRPTLQAIWDAPWRFLLTVICFAVLVPLTLRFLPTGFQ